MCVCARVYVCIYTYIWSKNIIPPAIMHSPILTWNTSPCKFCQLSSSIKVDNSKREVHHMAAEGAQKDGEGS